jgi:hypothetical protein
MEQNINKSNLSVEHSKSDVGMFLAYVISWHVPSLCYILKNT